MHDNCHPQKDSWYSFFNHTPKRSSCTRAHCTLHGTCLGRTALPRALSLWKLTERWSHNWRKWHWTVSQLNSRWMAQVAMDWFIIAPLKPLGVGPSTFTIIGSRHALHPHNDLCANSPPRPVQLPNCHKTKYGSDAPSCGRRCSHVGSECM